MDRLLQLVYEQLDLAQQEHSTLEVKAAILEFRFQHPEKGKPKITEETIKLCDRALLLSVDKIAALEAQIERLKTVK